MAKLGSFDIPEITLNKCIDVCRPINSSKDRSMSRLEFSVLINMSARGGQFSKLINSCKAWGLIEGREFYNINQIAYKVFNPSNSNGNTSASGDVYYYRDPSNNYFVIWYDHVVRYQGTVNPNYGEFDFQIVLYRDGRFDINYREMIGDVSSATIGFQNASGNEGTSIIHNWF